MFGDILSLARLPVPPLPHGTDYNILNAGLNRLLGFMVIISDLCEFTLQAN